MNNRLWYINMALAALLVLTWIVATMGLPGYPSDAVFDKNAYKTGSSDSGGQESESQTISAAKGFSNWLDPPPAYGNVRINIEPAEVLAAGGGWRVGGEPWLESGFLAEKITPGEKTVTFKNIKGWVTPSLTVTVEKDKTVEVTATYTVPPRGYVKVSIAPENVAAFSPQWQIDDGQWLNSGDTSQVTTVGSYNLSFTEIEGWDKPEVTVTIEDQKTLEVTAEYKLVRYGNINVVASEGATIPQGAGWKSGGSDWLEFGVGPQKTRFGSYEISFKEVADWDSPANIVLTVEEEKTYDIEAAYTPIPYAQVTVGIKPSDDKRLSGAQWRLDERQWLNFGQVAEKVRMGRHVLSFSVVEGWHPVSNQEIEIAEEKLYEFGGEYVRIRPPAPTFSFRSVLETGGGKGMAFISVKEGYRVGEEKDGFRIVRVEKSKVILKKEDFEYTVEVAENNQLIAPSGMSVPPSPAKTRPGIHGSGNPDPIRPGMPPEGARSGMPPMRTPDVK